MIKSTIFLVVGLLLIMGPAKSQTLTIDSCYARALRNYPLIKQYDLIEKTKEYNLSNANKAYLPQVSLTAIGGYIFGGFPSTGPSSESSNFKFIGIAQVNQTIWDGGATKTQKNILQASTETEKASVEVQLNDLKSRVNQLYFGILLVDEQLNQLRIQDSILINNLNRIKLLHDNGYAYKTDVDEIRVERLKLDQQRREFRYTRDGYTIMLSLLTGQKINDQTVLEKPPFNNQIADLQIIRPELALYKSQRNLVNAQEGMQHVDMMPKIGLLGAAAVIAPGISLGNSKLSSIGVAGLSGSWSIGALYKNSNEKKLAQMAIDKINVQEENFLFNTNLQMTQVSANLNKQKAILAADDEIVSLRQSIREGYQLKYSTGVGPLIDFLNATEKEGDARAQKALHEMQYLMTIYDYKTISGN